MKRWAIMSSPLVLAAMVATDIINNPGHRYTLEEYVPFFGKIE
jgi:hypothetical protein